ncbi:membrane protein FAM174A isoform X2 [Artibeus jamaicensis]|uniref:membrane protein FAM174A isoform X1 n=1 Tax=Artibeus jamaicensis TaxID=9417 RepID=UPI00187CD7C1|nr:membrane protein FAM174A isoform X1 [Artibeus jamaicensis]XP_037009731.1 membrane protein FAM174A isoform X2 [Artibeus jamaicensis]
MKGLHCRCCPRRLLASALLLLLLLPGLRGPLAVLLQAAEAAADSGPRDRGPRTLSPLPPGPTAAHSPGGARAEAAAPRSAEGGNGSSPRAAPAANDLAGKAGGEGLVGGAASGSDPEMEKSTTQRALTVLMVVSGVVLVYFVVRTVRMRRRNRKTRRYGVLDTNIENMELTPLEQDDEDDDTTLFDANHPRR